MNAISLNIDIIDGTVEANNYIPITVEPRPIRYDEMYYLGQRDVVKVGQKCWLPDEWKEQIREELVQGDGYYNSKWHGILMNYRIDEDFIREILDYIGIDFLKQYQYLSNDFARELEDNSFVRP